jgi:hypothetical protein
VTRSTDADVGTCAHCGRTIYRTNMDGRWHHPTRVPNPHAAQPERTPCDACATARVICGLMIGERYCDGSPADVVDTPI